jgi:CubicO group peptidase (beta-lactamase class C family)
MGRLMIGGFILAAAVGCGGESDALPPPDIDFTPFDEAVSDFLVQQELDGATAVVVHRDYGILHVRGYGAFPEDRISLVASSSKVLSAGILMHLADAGLFDADVPISEHLGAWGEHKTDVTVAQLLSNSAGLPGLMDDPLYGPYLCQFLALGSLSDCAKAIYSADDTDDRVPPDTQFRYGGGQWQLAGGLAELVSGRTWSELVDEVYTTPCGLEATGFGNHFAQGTSGDGDGGGLANLTYPLFFEGDPDNLQATDNPNIEGGAYTTAPDYGRILLMHLRDGQCDGGRVLSAESVARMRADRIGEVYGGSTIDPTMQGYGFGWWVDRGDRNVVSDGGAYGSMPWLDVGRGYGAMIILEGQATQGVMLRLEARPILESILDEALP